MDKLESQTSKEATWRNRLARHAASGKSIAAFCRDEAISQANFHVWRAKFTNGANEHAAPPTPQSTFIVSGQSSHLPYGKKTVHPSDFLAKDIYVIVPNAPNYTRQLG